MDQTGNKIGQFLKKYSTTLLILFLGILLMLLPITEKKETKATVSMSTEVAKKEMALQEELSVLLSQVEGAGNVQVLLTQATGAKTIYQEKNNSSGSDTIILTDSSRNQSGLIRQIDPPTYLGAIILCQGAYDPSIKLAITQAISSATGLGYDKITVLKMK